MNKTLSVSAIQNGTVIDHISSGQALRIIRMLGLAKYQVTIGLNLSSKRLRHKDLIKVENHNLTKEEADKITVFAPEATINIIKNFVVTEKIIAQLPSHVSAIFSCMNPVCITQSEPIETFFSLSEQGNQVQLTCKHCEKSFNRNEAKLKI